MFTNLLNVFSGDYGIILGVLIVTCFVTFVVETAFVYALTVKHLLKLKVKLPLEMKAIAYFWLIIGYPSDILFNVFRGTVMFRELPHEGLFTHRVQRHIDKNHLLLPENRNWRYDKALEWALVLNAIDPDHITFPV